jgi:hypothetical protein
LEPPCIKGIDRYSVYTGSFNNFTVYDNVQDLAILIPVLFLQALTSDKIIPVILLELNLKKNKNTHFELEFTNIE